MGRALGGNVATKADLTEVRVVLEADVAAVKADIEQLRLNAGGPRRCESGYRAATELKVRAALGPTSLERDREIGRCLRCRPARTARKEPTQP